MAYGNDGQATGARIVVAKTDATGNLDRTFGNNGIARIADFGSADRRVRRDFLSSAVLADGSIVVSISSIFAAGRAGSYLAKLRANGTIDTDFGSGGYIERTGTLESDNDDQIRAIIPQANGTFVAATVQPLNGTQSALNNPTGIRTRLIKFTKNGAVDNGFGSNGIRDIANCQFVSLSSASVAAIAEGLLVGCQRHVGVPGAANFTLAEASVAKVLSNGNLDSTFGVDGRSNFRTRLLDIGNFNAAKQEAVVAILRSPNSKFIFAVTRESNPMVYNGNDVRIARLTLTGQLDSTYGTNGVATAIGIDFNESIFSAEILPDDRLVFATSPIAINTGNGVVPFRGNGARIVRVLANGQLDR